MEESKALGVGVILLDLHIFGGDIKAKKARVCPRLLSLSFPLNETKQNIPYTSPAIHGLSQEPVQTHGPILCLLLWTKLFYISAESQDHVGQKNGWL